MFSLNFVVSENEHLLGSSPLSDDSDDDYYSSGSESDYDPDEDIKEALMMEYDSDSEMVLPFKLLFKLPSSETIDFSNWPRPKGVTVPYSEPQSVHTFMDDTRDLTLWLVKKYPLTTFPYTRPFDHWLFDLCERTFETVLNDCYRLIDILNAVLHYIRESPHKDTLYQILTDDADRNKDVCTSGYITLLVTTVRGFPGVPTFKGQVFEHMRQMVYHHLNKTIDFSDPERVIQQIQAQSKVLLNLECQSDDLLQILTKYTGVQWALDRDGGLEALI